MLVVEYPLERLCGATLPTALSLETPVLDFHLCLYILSFIFANNKTESYETNIVFLFGICPWGYGGISYCGK